MTLPLVDTHAHLDMAEYADDRAAVVERFRTAGGETLILAADDLPASTAARDLAAHYGVPFMAGVHPHTARDLNPAEWHALRTLWRDPRCCAVGEIGLDYHYPGHDMGAQQRMCTALLAAAVEAERPVIIHARDADADAAAVLREFLPRLRGGILHCHNGSALLAETVLAFPGWYLSFAGPVTYPKAQRLRDAVAATPADRLLTETDAPYLTPQPRRGERNEPAYVAQLLPVMAAARGIAEEELAALIAANACAFLTLTTTQS